MRVTGGTLRGRPLAAPAGRATRPTTDKVREALFGVLGSLEGDRVADLYAGTGALGIEALSRGALSACFVEVASQACRTISKNLISLGLSDRGRVFQLDLARAGRVLASAGPFDVVFCDPPWTNFERAVDLVSRLPWSQLLGSCGRLCIEHPSREALQPTLPSEVVLVSTRRWGDTAVSIWERSMTGASSPDGHLAEDGLG